MAMSSRVVGALAAAAAVVLAVPGLMAVTTPDLRISTAVDQSGDLRTVVLRTGAAEMLCTVRLHLTVDHPRQPQFQATLAGRPLIAQHERAGTIANAWTVRLLPPPSPAGTLASAAGLAAGTAGTHADAGAISAYVDHFAWPPGGEIRVSVPGAKNLGIERWEVYDTRLGADSSDLASQRRWTFWTTLGLVALAMMGAASSAWSPKAAAPPPITAAGIVHGLIDSMPGDGHDRSRQILTRMLIDRTGVEEALEATGLPKMQQHQEFLRTAGRFKARLHNLKQDLAQYCHILDGATAEEAKSAARAGSDVASPPFTAAAALAGESALHVASLLAQVDARYREEVRRFLQTGEASKECLAYIERNPVCQQAIQRTLGTHAAAFERLASTMIPETTPISVRRPQARA